MGEHLLAIILALFSVLGGAVGWVLKLIFSNKSETEKQGVVQDNHGKRLDKLEREMEKFDNMGERLAAFETTLKTLDKIPEKFATLEESVKGGFRRTDEGFITLGRTMERMEAQLIRQQANENSGNRN